jgi:HlyD family secretion protein
VKNILKTAGIVLVALVLVGAGALLLLRQQNPDSAADTAPPTTIVTRGSIEETISATGNVAAERQATLAFEMSGPIAEVLVGEGQQVEAGQVLARLDTASLEWQVARAQASLDTAQARLDQASEPPSAADLASAQAALDSAIASYDKVSAGPTKEELASAQAALDSAMSNYESVQEGPTEEELAAARAAMDSARAALQQAQAAYDRIKDQPDVQMRQESLALQNATIEYERAKANYQAVASRPTESELASAATQVASAEFQLAQLLERPTESELASAAAQVASAEATLAQLQERPKVEDVTVSQAQVEEAVIALDQAQSELEGAIITAPFAGTILSVQVNEGEWASPGAPAIILAATQLLILDVNVDEIDVGQLAERQPARLSFDAIKGEEVAGMVAHIDPASTNVGGAVAYGVEISFDPGDLAVRLGMTADVDIVVASAEDAMLVPNRAIEADREAGRYYVTRQKSDGSTERLEVRISLRDASQTQILEGLEEGDRLVLPEVPGQEQNQQFPGGPGGGMFGGMGQRGNP